MKRPLPSGRVGAGEEVFEGGGFGALGVGALGGLGELLGVAEEDEAAGGHGDGEGVARGSPARLRGDDAGRCIAADGSPLRGGYSRLECLCQEPWRLRAIGNAWEVLLKEGRELARGHVSRSRSPDN
jgi:hypothetical protein